MGEFSGFFKLLVKALEESKVNYVIVGGLVSIRLGRPRLTQDIDVIIDADEEALKILTVYLKGNGFEVDEEAFVENILKHKIRSTVFHTDFPILHADIKGVYNELDKEVMRNRERAEIFGVEAWAESLEDNIVAKLVYGSQQDIEDALAVMVAQEDRINMNVLVEKSGKFGVIDRLNQLIEEKKKFFK
ncbi:MAG: DUF6036 family nucleotidyltransferase [Thermoproteota archaeon]